MGERKRIKDTTRQHIDEREFMHFVEKYENRWRITKTYELLPHIYDETFKSVFSLSGNTLRSDGGRAHAPDARGGRCVPGAHPAGAPPSSITHNFLPSLPSTQRDSRGQVRWRHT